MKHWKPIAAGSLIAAATVVSFAMMNRPRSSVEADHPPAQQQNSIASRIFGPETVTAPAGTKIYIRLEQAIHSERNSPGDQFTASLNGPLVMDGKVLAPSRSKVIGRLTDVKPSGRVEGRARVTMVLAKLMVDGTDYDLETQPLTLVARSTQKKDAAVIAGGAAAGAVIGAITGGGKGAAIGAGVGAGSGTGYVLATKGAPVAYGPESRFSFTLSSPVELPVLRKIGGTDARGET